MAKIGPSRDSRHRGHIIEARAADGFVVVVI